MTRPIGRPDDYRPEYCQMLIKHMASGFSFESFAGEVDVDRATIYRWCDRHQDFSDAKQKGRAKGLKFDEQLLLAITAGKIKGNIAGIIFKLKCKYRDDWREDDVQKPISIDFNVLPIPEILRQLNELDPFNKVKDAAIEVAKLKELPID